MSFVAIGFWLVLFGFLSIGAVEWLRGNSIDTRFRRLGVIRRADKPVAFWGIVVGSLAINGYVASMLVNWALTK